MNNYGDVGHCCIKKKGLRTMFKTSLPGSDHQTILDWLSYTPDICYEGMIYRDVAVGCGCERVGGTVGQRARLCSSRPYVIRAQHSRRVSARGYSISVTAESVPAQRRPCELRGYRLSGVREWTDVPTRILPRGPRSHCNLLQLPARRRAALRPLML